MEKKVCEICKIEFIPKRPHQRFCCKKCSDIFWKPKKPKVTKKCANPKCQKEFEGNIKDKYCCVDCRIAVSNAKMRAYMRQPEDKYKCFWCGKVVWSRVASPFCNSNHKKLWLKREEEKTKNGK